MYHDFLNSVSLTTGPRFGNLLGGTAIHISGPCFNESDIIRCTFDGQQEKTGMIINNLTAICISPSFKDVGWKSLTLTIIEGSGAGEVIYTGQSRYYAGN